MDNKTLKKALEILDQKGAILEELAREIDALEHYIEEQDEKMVKYQEEEIKGIIKLLLNN